MKRIINIFSLLVMVFIAGCELEPQVQISENPVAPQIISPTSNQAFAFTWDNNTDDFQVIFSGADYGFPISPSYTVQIDKQGGDFTRAQSLGIITNDTLVIPVSKFNSAVKKMKFVDGDVAALEMRVTSYVSKFYEDLVSPLIPISFVPYSEPVVVEPIDTTPVVTINELYLIGASTGAWDTGRAVALTAGEAGVFTGLVHFSSASDGRNWRFFKQPDWGSSYGGYDVFETYPVDLLEPAATDSDPNFNFIGETGWYKLVVDVNKKTIAMTAADAPELYLTGDATHGWNWNDPVSTVFGTGNFVYEGDIAFIQNNAFRVFAQKDWSPTSYGWDYLTNYDPAVINVMEGHADPNWQFLLESGTYQVKIDMKALSIEITK